MKKRYEWRVLTDEGLLKKPDPTGPYYDQDSVNTCGGFDSEASACEAYEAFKARNKWGVQHELVLVCFYSPEDA